MKLQNKFNNINVNENNKLSDEDISYFEKEEQYYLSIYNELVSMKTKFEQFASESNYAYKYQLDFEKAINTCSSHFISKIHEYILKKYDINFNYYKCEETLLKKDYQTRYKQLKYKDILDFFFGDCIKENNFEKVRLNQIKDIISIYQYEIANNNKLILNSFYLDRSFYSNKLTRDGLSKIENFVKSLLYIEDNIIPKNDNEKLIDISNKIAENPYKKIELGLSNLDSIRFYINKKVDIKFNNEYNVNKWINNFIKV